MEKKETASAAKPLGVCEKLYNALHPNAAFRRPLLIRTFRNQNPATTTTTTNNNIEKNQNPQGSHPTHMKPSQAPQEKVEPVEVVVQVVHKLPAKTQVITPPTTMPTTTTTTTTRKVAEKVLPTPAPPKGVAVTNAAPLPTPAEPEEPKKNINQEAQDYIIRAKEKISWSSSGVGKTPES